MAQANNFRPPVFVRNDDTTTIEASVIEWGDSLDNDVSIKFSNSDCSVLINARDWEAVKATIDAELRRVGE